MVPDNVFFEGGTGETVRRNLLQQCDVQTLLRLPASSTLKAAKPTCCSSKQIGTGKPWTKNLWVYNLRTDKHFTLKNDAAIGPRIKSPMAAGGAPALMIFLML